MRHEGTVPRMLALEDRPCLGGTPSQGVSTLAWHVGLWGPRMGDLSQSACPWPWHPSRGGFPAQSQVQAPTSLSRDKVTKPSRCRHPLLFRDEVTVNELREREEAVRTATASASTARPSPRFTGELHDAEKPHRSHPVRSPSPTLNRRDARPPPCSRRPSSRTPWSGAPPRARRPVPASPLEGGSRVRLSVIG